MEVAVEPPVDAEPHSQPLDPVPTEAPQQQHPIMPPANPPFPISTTTTESAAPDRPAEPQMPSPPPEAVPSTTTNVAQPTESDAMDTTPDQSSQPEPATEPVPEQEQEQTQDPPPVEASNAMDADVPMVSSETPIDPQTLPSEQATTEQAPTEGENPAEVNDNNTTADAPNPTTESTGDSSEGSTQPTSEGSTESNESSDSSADEEDEMEEKEEEEAAYWADIEEDTSSPDEAELKEIEAADLDYSAYKYDYWEKTFYPSLQDPEYRPSQKARLTWKIKGVRGTKEKPNRATIIRSPPAYIGGYYWTVKFFPRGNSVSSLSVYIECSKTPPEQDKENLETEFKVITGPPDAVLKDLTPDVDISIPATVIPKNKQESSPEGDSEKQEQNGEAVDNPDKPSDESESAETKEDKKNWRVSAQIGVIIYNPDEPRTACSQSSSHQFNPHNVDWGWTHFHGPWDQIHRRHNGQRQALLRNDTLTFDAYIRIFDDSTQSLWWHESDAEPVWDSLTLTGYRPMGDPTVDYSYEVAGLVSWLLITPFREIIQEVDVLEHLTNPNVKPRMLCSALQRMLWATHTQPAFPDLSISTEQVTTALRNLREFSGDTSEFWERMRRTLELELEGTDAIEKLARIFDSPRVEGLPNGVNEISPINHLPQHPSPTIRVPVTSSKSIQGATTKFLQERPGQWSLPSVLHVEMIRQTFDKSSRQWNMLFDRVKLDEKLDLSDSVVPGQSGEYDLYGMVVHKGSRSSGRFFSILRPGGPDTRWLAFEDSSNNKITCLTRRGAIDDHEGLDADQLMQSGDKCAPDVAVIAIYVRSDSVKEYLTGKIEPWDVPYPTAYAFKHAYHTLNHLMKNEAYPEIKIEFYSLADFSSISESLVDCYDLMAASKSAGGYSCITVPPGTTFAELRNKIAALKSTENEVVSHENVRFWEMGSGPTLQLRGADLIEPVVNPQLSVLRLWVHILSEEDATRFALPEPPKSINSFEYESGETPADDQPQESQDEQNAVQNTENAPETGDTEMDDAPAENQVAPPESASVPAEGAGQPNEAQPEQDNQPMADAPMAASTEDLPANNAEVPTESETQPYQELPPIVPGAAQEEQPSDNNAQESVDPGTVPADADVAMADDVAIAAIIAEEVEALDRLDNETQDAMDAEPSPPPEEASTQPTGTEESQAAPTSTSDQIQDAPQETATNDVAPPPQEEREATPPPPEAPPAEEDTDMADPPTTENPEGQPSEENAGENTTSESNPEPPRSKLISARRHVYYFIQLFDEQKQELALIKPVFAKRSNIIKESIRAALKWPEDRPFLLWHRVDGISAVAVSGSETFDNVVSEVFGECFVVGDVLDKAERTKLAEAGMFSAPDRLIHYLWAQKRQHPTKAFTGTQTAEATFNGDYFSGQFKNGYYHGKGTHISDSGTTYIGDFILGERQGKGLMEYASGDTYDGDWVEDQRDGHGTFIERKTGNKYVGGYRNGKRHGKGISYWEIADEEMDLCQICYSENQDSLFYSCGHVCACVSCARQVDICPMCRKKVLNVVKIYKS